MQNNDSTRIRQKILSCNGNPVFMIEHGYRWLFHGHAFLFYTDGQECTHSATKTWLTLKLFSDYYSQLLIDVNRLGFRKGLLSNYDVSFEQR